jgi:hypothetical protein
MTLKTFYTLDKRVPTHLLLSLSFSVQIVDSDNRILQRLVVLLALKQQRMITQNKMNILSTRRSVSCAQNRAMIDDYDIDPIVHVQLESWLPQQMFAALYEEGARRYELQLVSLK